MSAFADMAAQKIAAWSAAEHDERCSRGAQCAGRDWHIENDYVPRIRRQVRAQLIEAADALA